MKITIKMGGTDMSIVAKVYRGDIVDLTHIGYIALVDYTSKLFNFYMYDKER